MGAPYIYDISRLRVKKVKEFLPVPPYLLTNFVEICKEDLHVMPLNYCNFRKNRYKESQTFNWGITLNFATIIYTFYSICKNVSRNNHKFLISCCDFRKIKAMYFT